MFITSLSLYVCTGNCTVTPQFWETLQTHKTTHAHTESVSSHSKDKITKQSRTMFSFHKPKIYRSVQGCCICRAKSSSSRFTDSKRYEADFEKCFNIDENRRGEICNACVLLVKRWKKLPKGSLRNWEHVSSSLNYLGFVLKPLIVSFSIWLCLLAALCNHRKFTRLMKFRH